MATGRSSLGKPEEEHGDKLSQAEIDRREAIATLVDIGLLIPVRKMDLYHGRAGDGKNEWRVDPAFNNGSNATGNKNVNKRSALNTGNLEVANRFASARTR